MSLINKACEIEVWKNISDEDLARSIIRRRELGNKKDSDESFYICDLGKVLEKYEAWKLKCPDISIFYAVKCNNNPVLLRFMAAVGINFDCASKEEIENIVEMGVSPLRIIFTHPQKQREHLKYAKEVGVDLMVFDCLGELEKIKRICGVNFPRLVLRVYQDNSNSVYPFGDKFGAKESEFVGLISRVKQLNMNLVGISFHCGSGCTNADSFLNVIKTCKIAYDVAIQFGFQIEIIDIGGGYVDGNKNVITLNEAITSIRKQLKLSFSEKELARLSLIAEPGRYLANAAYNIVTKIFGKREIVDEKTKSSKMYYFVGDGTYASFNELLVYCTHQVIPVPVLLSKRNGNQTKPSWIFGPTCSGLDVVVKDAAIPELDIGDNLMFKNWGDYSSAASSGFNGFRVTEYYYVISEQWRNVFEKTTEDCTIKDIKFTDIELNGQD